MKNLQRALHCLITPCHQRNHSSAECTRVMGWDSRLSCMPAPRARIGVQSISAALKWGSRLLRTRPPPPECRSWGSPPHRSARMLQKAHRSGCHGWLLRSATASCQGWKVCSGSTLLKISLANMIAQNQPVHTKLGMNKLRYALRNRYDRLTEASKIRNTSFKYVQINVHGS